MKEEWVFLSSVVPAVNDQATDKEGDKLQELFTKECKETFENCKKVFKDIEPVFIEKYDLDSLKAWVKEAVESKKGTLSTIEDAWLGGTEWQLKYLQTDDIAFLDVETNGIQIKFVLADTTTLIIQSKEVEDLTTYVLHELRKT